MKEEGGKGKKKSGKGKGGKGKAKEEKEKDKEDGEEGDAKEEGTVLDEIWPKKEALGLTKWYVQAGCPLLLSP